LGKCHSEQLIIIPSDQNNVSLRLRSNLTLPNKQHPSVASRRTRRMTLFGIIILTQHLDEMIELGLAQDCVGAVS